MTRTSHTAEPTDPGRPQRSPQTQLDAGHWQRRLDALAERHQVPGAVLGILRLCPGGRDELMEAAYGVLNKDTGVPVTTDSLFQIGSITKVWTATQVMQLVDEARLDLDASVLDVIPELRLPDPEAAKRLTMRHLLTHTSGIDGDLFIDTGRGDDCLERLVGLLGGIPQNHPVGATWSYCNSGFSLAGRIVEKLTGMTWDQALRERIVAPLGLEHTVTLPEDALLYRAAVGHASLGEAAPSRVSFWGLARSGGPAGQIISTAADVLAFARMHLCAGAAADGTSVLSAESTAAMAGYHASTEPDQQTLGDSWGLGWQRFGLDGHRLIGHNGNTHGQAAFLRLLPEQGLAVTLLTNGGNTPDLYEDLYGEILAEVAGVAMPQALTPPVEPVSVDIRRHLGRYVRASTIIEVFERDGTPVLRHTTTGSLAELVPPVQEFTLQAVDESGDAFLVRQPQLRTWQPVTFYSLPTGEQYLHHSARATPKVD